MLKKFEKFINKEIFLIIMKKLQNKFIRLWLIIGIVAGFTAILFFVTTYLNNKILCTLECRYKNEIILALVLVGLFGLFIGSLTYYFISEKKEKEINKISKQVHKSSIATLNFLEPDQRKIIKVLIDNNGEIMQSAFVKKTGLSRVTISRNLSNLGKKGIVSKKQSGMTNTIKIDNSLKELFCENENNKNN